jgi:hypothetical protein
VLTVVTNYYFHAKNMKGAKDIANDPLVLKEMQQQTERTIVCEDGEEEAYL